MIIGIGIDIVDIKRIEKVINKLGFIEPEGILKGSAIKVRIRIAIKIANKIDFKLLKNEPLDFIFYELQYLQWHNFFHHSTKHRCNKV